MFLGCFFVIIKDTRSKKAVLVVDDFGRVYVISKVSLSNFLYGVDGISVLTRLPFDVDPLRFKRSPVFWNGKVISADDFDKLNVGFKRFDGSSDYMGFVEGRRKGSFVDIKRIEGFGDW